MGFYGKKLFHRHKKQCTGDSVHEPLALNIGTLGSDLQDDKFTTEVVSRFQEDDVGECCKTDSTILLTGQRQFQRHRRKMDKAIETKK